MNPYTYPLNGYVYPAGPHRASTTQQPSPQTYYYTPAQALTRPAAAAPMQQGVQYPNASYVTAGATYFANTVNVYEAPRSTCSTCNTKLTCSACSYSRPPPYPYTATPRPQYTVTPPKQYAQIAPAPHQTQYYAGVTQPAAQPYNVSYFTAPQSYQPYPPTPDYPQPRVVEIKEEDAAVQTAVMPGTYVEENKTSPPAKISIPKGTVPPGYCFNTHGQVVPDPLALNVTGSAPISTSKGAVPLGYCLNAHGQVVVDPLVTKAKSPPAKVASPAPSRARSPTRSKAGSPVPSKVGSPPTVRMSVKKGQIPPGMQKNADGTLSVIPAAETSGWEKPAENGWGPGSEKAASNGWGSNKKSDKAASNSGWDKASKASKAPSIGEWGAVKGKPASVRAPSNKASSAAGDWNKGGPSSPKAASVKAASIAGSSKQQKIVTHQKAEVAGDWDKSAEAGSGWDAPAAKGNWTTRASAAGGWDADDAMKKAQKAEWGNGDPALGSWADVKDNNGW